PPARRTIALAHRCMQLGRVPCRSLTTMTCQGRVGMSSSSIRYSPFAIRHCLATRLPFPVWDRLSACHAARDGGCLYETASLHQPRSAQQTVRSRRRTARHPAPTCLRAYVPPCLSRSLRRFPPCLRASVPSSLLP